MTTAINLPADSFDTGMTFVRPDPAPTRVPLDRLAVLPGFNTRVKDEDYNERVVGIAESIVAHGFFDDKPFAVTMIDGDNTVYIYDGEHRYDAAKQAILDGADFSDGLPVAWAKDGSTVKDLTIHLAHGNNGERLNMVELAAVVRRMQGLGMEKPEIATALGRTTRHIDNLFVLADSNQTIKKAVAGGEIAGAEAVKLIRKHGSKDAATKITEAVKAAKERGKAKATPKSMANKPTGPKMKTIAVEQSMPEGETMGEVLKALAKKVREHVQIGEGDKLAETGMIRIKLEVIDHEAEAAKVEAERAKAEAAEKRAAEKAAREKAKAEADAAKKKAAAEKKKAADKKKADAAKKKAAEQALLAEAAAKGSDAKAKPAPKKATAPKKSTTAKAATGTKGKAASGGKVAEGAQKPAQGDSGAKATQVADVPGTAPSDPESGAEQASSGTDENNGL